MTDPSPDSPPPRTTGGHWRWEPPSPSELEAMLPDYSVEKLLGRGGMGAVYKGVQSNLDRTVAIKILPDGIGKEDFGYAERFRNEAKVMARLLHPAIVAVFDFGETPAGQLYFVMEYVDGTDVQAMLSGRTRLPAEHAHAVAAHVCDALAAAHGLGIVHRDIKPANVLINLQGQVKVADFGLAKFEEPGRQGLTQAGIALGTPDYVAPEALVLGAEVDARADLYAVGVMLYTMLTGELPRGAWKSPSEKVPGLDPRFDDIVDRAMQVYPEDRYQSALELRRDLDVIVAVPMVQKDGAQSAALPQQAVAEAPGRRSAAAKVPARGRRTGKSSGPNELPSASPSRKRVMLLGAGLALAIFVGGGLYFLFASKNEDIDSNLLQAAANSAQPAPHEEDKNSNAVSNPSPASSPLVSPPLTTAMDANHLKSEPEDEPKPPLNPPTGETASTETSAPPPKGTVPVTEPSAAETSDGGSVPMAATPAEESPEEAKSESSASDAPKVVESVSSGLVDPASLLEEAKKRGGTLRALGHGPNGPFDVGAAAEFDDFVQVSASHFGWAARRSAGQVYAGTWQGAPPQPYLPLGPYETKHLSRAALINMVMDDGTSRNVWSNTSQPSSASPPGADRVIAVMNHMFRLQPDGRQHRTYGSSSPESPEFFLGSQLVSGTQDHFLRHAPGEPVRSWHPASATEFTFPEATRDTVEMDGGGSHLVLRDSAGKVSVWTPTGTPLEPDKALVANLPTDQGPFVAVRAGTGMAAAQKADGSWLAWGESPDLAQQIEEIGIALDLDLFHDEKASFAMWIVPGRDASAFTTTPTLPADIAERLAAIDAQFETAYNRDIAPPHLTAVADLDTKYAAAVRRALTAATQGGHLDEAVALREETQRLVEKSALPASEPASSPESLVKLRTTYRDAIAKLEADRLAKAKPYFDRHDQLLDAYQRELTQENRIDDALLVKRHRDRIAASRGAPVSAPRVSSASPSASPSAAAVAPAPTPSGNTSANSLAASDPLDPGHDLSKLPPWLQDAAKSGGKLRVWGYLEGKPINEREVLKDFRESDFTHAVTGVDGLILGVQRQRKAKRIFFSSTISEYRNLLEYRELHAFDRRSGIWLADRFLQSVHRAGNELKLAENAMVRGQGDGHFIRVASGDWIAGGYHWGGNPEDPGMAAEMEKLCDWMTEDETSLVACERGGIALWITKENKLRRFQLSLRPGIATEVPVTDQPREKIVDLIRGGLPPFGQWIARGESGSVYSEGTGGFASLIEEVSPAVALRFANWSGTIDGKPIQSTTLAARKPDGTWHATGTDEELKQFIAGIGPALDLDLHVDNKLKIVLWIEPKTGLKP